MSVLEWEAIPTLWRVILKKNLVFQTELVAIQQSQSKFAARYYDMDTYWKVFFSGRELDLSITDDELELIRNLKKVNCDGTKVDSFDLLADLGLWNLETVDGSHTGIAEIGALALLEQLEILAIEYTEVSDLTPLKENTRLRKLYFSHTNVTDIGVLEQFGGLTNLDFNDIGVVDVSVLGHLSKLETLVMNGCCGVRDIEALGATSGLVKLDISRTGVQSIDCLAEHCDLRILVAGGLDLSSIDVVAQLQALESLYVNNSTAIIDLTCLEACPNLKALYIAGTEVTGEESLLQSDSLTMLFHDGLSPSFCEALAAANPQCSIVHQ